MSDKHADIRPTGLSQKNLVDFLYGVVASFAGITAKMDDDTGASLALDTYEANCYTAMFNTIIYDSKGNRTGVAQAESSTITPTQIISPTGCSPAALVDLLYQIFNAMETLTEQMDSEALSGYETACYTNIFTANVTNTKGNTLGNGTAFYFTPQGPAPTRELVDLLYKMADGWETLCEALDAEGAGVTDDDYESLWFTATYTTLVMNKEGKILGKNLALTY